MEDILAAVDSLLGNATNELLGEAQIRTQSSTQLLETLDEFVKRVDELLNSFLKAPFDISTLDTRFPNVAFSINRDMFTRDLFFVARNIGGKVVVNITTDAGQSEITKGTFTVIKIPKQTFRNHSETVYSYYFKEASLFLTESQLLNIKGNATQINKLVDGNVLSATVGFREVSNLSEPVILTFKKSEQQTLEGNLTCQFYDPNGGEKFCGGLAECLAQYNFHFRFVS